MPPRTSPNRASLAGIKDPLYPALKAPVNEIRESGAWRWPGIAGEASSTSVDMFYEFRVIACFPQEDLQWRDSVWAAAMFFSGGGGVGWGGQEDCCSFAILWSARFFAGW